ncbi:MAG: hypothetical protein ACOC53_01315 [Candidatus Saliniplasma sp.]
MSCVEVLEDHESQITEESTDFIQSHVDSFFPLDEEVKEEKCIDEFLENEDASGPVVNVLSGEVGDADEAKEVLDFLLYSDEDLENRVANYTVLETPQTAGLATDLIRLIPWTGFEMGETGELPKEVTYTDVIVPRAAGASKKVNVYSN